MCARIAQQLGSGHSEKVYQEALAAELRVAGWNVELERVVPTMYDPGNQGNLISVGFARLDILAVKGSESILIELKATSSFSPAPLKAQINIYLKALKTSYPNLVGYGIQFMQPGSKDVLVEDMVQIIVVLSPLAPLPSLSLASS
jgi:GxxExxY protein